MVKALCIAALLFGLLMATGHNSAAASGTTFTFPVIVAKGRLVSQTATIPTTTIFTPNQDGIYRLSFYGTITQSDFTSNSQWWVYAYWTDDSGPQSVNPLLAGGSKFTGQFSLYNFSPASSPIVFEAKAATAITYNVAQAGVPDNSIYSIYYTLERLQ
jgi:hypothetical protein